MFRDRSAPNRKNIRVGPAGWYYQDWMGIVYAVSKRTRPLELLSALFDVVEINTTFYRPIEAKVSAQWCQQVAANPQFRFTTKVWKKFTHEGTSFSEGDMRQFLRGLEPLIQDGWLGALLLQFPWSFKRTRENRMVLAHLVESFKEYPLAIEFRHESWNVAEVISEFRSRDLCLCSIDQPMIKGAMPPIDDNTSQLAYFRLHGRNDKHWFAENSGRDQRYDYLYSEEELSPWIERAKRMIQQADDLYIITNNHYRGKAVVNALEIQHMLGKKNLQVPQNLLAHYPRLQRLREDPT